MHCGYQYTPEPKKQGYPREIRERAVQMYVDEMSLRKIGCHLGLQHRTVSLWFEAHTELLPEPPMSESVNIAEMDEMFTFIGDKKTRSTF